MTLIQQPFSPVERGTSVIQSERPQNPAPFTSWTNPQTGDSEYYNGFAWVPLNLPPSAFGTGALGDVSITTNTALDPSVEYNYRDLRISSGVTITPSSSNTPLVIRCTGDCFLDGVTFNFDYQGAPGGAAVTTLAATVAASAGIAGTNGASLLSTYTSGAGGGGGPELGSTNSSGGGGGGGSVINPGVVGQTGGTGTPAGGTAGAVASANLGALLANVQRDIVCGAGGGSGGTNRNFGANRTSGKGGAGGGAILIIARGSIYLTGTTFNVRGEDGGTGSAGASGGGGGGGGAALLFYGRTKTGSATFNVDGGALGGGERNGGTGGNGVGLTFSIA